MVTPGPFAQYAAFMLEGDFSPVPIKVGKKRPLFDNWDRLRSAALTPHEIEALCRKHPGLGLGVAGGFMGLVPIDVDTDDREIIDAIMSALPRPEVVKFGQRGFTAFYHDAYGCIAGQKFRHPRMDGGFDTLAEVLATGQSVIPPTIHPDIGRPYEWLTSATLLNTRVDELPVITKAHIEALREALGPWLPRPVLYAPPKLPKPAKAFQASTGKRMTAYAEAILANEARKLSGLSAGRNWALFCAASNLGKFVHHGVLSRSEVENALIGATMTNGYATAKHGGMKKTCATLRSGLEKARSDALPNLNSTRERGKLRSDQTERTTA